MSTQGTSNQNLSVENPQSATPQTDVVVVGGGLAGLAAAATIAQAGHSVTVHEQRKTLGGQARSAQREGFTLNQGPHAFYRGGPGERVLTQLGVALNGGRPPTKGRLIFDGTGHIAPAGPGTLLRTKALSLGDKFHIGSLLARLPRMDAAALSSVTVADWIEGLGSKERPAQMIRSLVRLATYVHQPDQLSADVAVSQLQLALGPGVLYLHGGWQSIVDQLRSTPGINFVSGGAVSELPDAKAVVLAVGGPPSTAKLLGRSFDVGPAARAGCLDLGLRRRPDVGLVIGGDVPFYFSHHTAVAKLAPEGQYLASSLQYLADGDDPDDQAIKAFTLHGGVREDDVVMTRRLHSMTSVTAIPTATRGGLPGRPSISDTGHDNVFMAGDWIGPEGHLADASLASGQKAGAAALKALQQVGAR